MMWIAATISDEVYQYTLTTPENVATAVYDELSYSFAGVITYPTDVKFNDDFTAMYITRQNNNKIFQFAIPESIQTLTCNYKNSKYRT